MFVRCSILLCCLLGAIAGVGAPLSGSETAGQFFESVAGSFLKEELGVDLHHIPIYPTNRYSQDLHRLLQVTANLYDTTTNRGDAYPWFPTCFRPRFGTNGDEVFISGYVEEPGATFNVRPWHELENPADRPIADDNVYGVPIIIGARKGFPNFNECALQTVVDVTRKLEVLKDFPGGRLIETNQMFLIGISNTLALELWNPWEQDYPRDLLLKVVAETTCALTNTHGFVQVSTVTSATNFVWFAGADRFKGHQFRVPVAVTASMLSNSVFRTAPQEHFEFPIQSGFERAPAFPTNQWTLTTKTRLLILLFDGTHLVDATAHSDFTSAFNISAELARSDGDPYDLWNPLSAGNVSLGVRRQIDASIGSLALPDWNLVGIHQFIGSERENSIQAFRMFLGQTPPASPLTNVAMQAPLTPTRKMVQTTTWEARDPLLHQLAQQLFENDPDSRVQTVLPSSLVRIENGSSIGRLNRAYSPWGGNPNELFLDPIAVDPAFKDPGVVSCDYWQFPSGSALRLENIGQIHRGAPWQTIYLKSAIAAPEIWELWHGDSSGHPTNDWKLIDILSSLLQTNAPQNLLSVNSNDRGAWRAAFDGFLVTSNSSECALTDITVAPDLPELGVVIDGIIRAGATSPRGYFDTLGALLSTPELTFRSPWLNLESTWVYCLTDKALEALPSQLLSRVRSDPVAAIADSTLPLRIRFVVLPGHTYQVQASDDLRTWKSIATNSITDSSFSFQAPQISDKSFYRLKLSD